MRNQKLIGILAIAIFALNLVLPFAAYAQEEEVAAAADPSDWYTKVNGVLTSDTYVLYPFTTTSVDMGLSKYGEMINYPVTPGIGVGLQYPGYDKVRTYDQKSGTSRDPFANEYIDPRYWLNGWLIEIRYTHRTARDRRVLAMALFADMHGYGGNWLVGHSFDLSAAPHGGRKTTGYAETEPLKVLYDGPRRYVALSVTHLYDWDDTDGDGKVDHPDETWALVDVRLTFIFEKVKKQVIILKDIKQVISGKELNSPLDIQFSNREEWDLGPAPDYDSYSHFYHQKFETCYGAEWHMAPGIMREWIEEGYALDEVPVWKGYYGPPIVDGSVRVYVNHVFKEEGRDYIINYDTGVISWKIPIRADDWVTVVYKLWKYPEEVEDDKKRIQGVPHLNDVAQIISRDKKVVGWKAFWPTLSDYTVDGWGLTFQPLIWVEDEDMVPATKEPDIPFVIGEWDFMLGYGYPPQFRGVEVVGLTDYHDAHDPQMDGRLGLDREIRYQLDEVFNPWDLVKAVHKETERWVEFETKSDGEFTTTYGPVIEVDDEDWDQYCKFSERVIDLTEGYELEAREGYNWRGQDTYKVKYNNDGTMTITGLDRGHDYKILYSTKLEGRYEWTIVGKDAASVDSVGAALVTAAFKNKQVEIGNAGLDMMEAEENLIPWVMCKFGAGNTWSDYFKAPKVTVLPTSLPGTRASLKDDWCTTWPVSSSNVISIGGPLINVLTSYVNDFTDAYYATWDFATDTGYGYYAKGAIVALPCWAKNYYYSGPDKGYAVIATYKDINGTVIFTIWGIWGRDTFYASKFFHEEIIYELQEADAFDHVTALILEIDYTHPEHPTFSIPEVLGTISEKEVGLKGGIHDP
jgi:hypothetical protein